MAYLSITCMLITISHAFAFHFARICFRTRKFFGVESTAAFFLDNFQALATVAFVATFSTNVIATAQCLLACISTWPDFLTARCLRYLYNQTTILRKKNY